MFKMEVKDAIKISQRKNRVTNKGLAAHIGKAPNSVCVLKKSPWLFRVGQFMKMARLLKWSDDEILTLLRWIEEDMKNEG